MLLSACQGQNSETTNIVDGETVDYFYQTYTMSADENLDTYQKYLVENGLVANDPSEKLLPKELQGVFFLDGAPFPDKTLSLKHVQPMDEKAQRIRWTVPYKTSFAWLNNDRGHHAFAKAKSHMLQYELEWRDCDDEVMADMKTQWEAMNVDGEPSRCIAADRRFAVINAFVSYEGERFAVPENILYFDMYLIPGNDERDYSIWHRRSKICNDNDSSSIKSLCSILSAVTGRNNGDGYSRYQFTQVVTPEGRRTSAYNQKLLPEVLEESGDQDNIFYVCDPSEQVGDNSCLDGTENLGPIEDREIEIIEEEARELSFPEKLIRTGKMGAYLVKLALDLTELFMASNHDK